MKRSVLALCLVLAAGSALADRVAIYDIQYTTNPTGDSPMVNQTVTLEGVVTAVFYNGFFVTDAPGAWSSIYVYSKKCGPMPGDQVSLTGQVQEYYNMTEIGNVTSCTILSTGNAYAPLVLETSEVSQEQYESVLVRVEGVTVSSLEGYGMWEIDDGSGPLLVDDDGDYLYFPAAGDQLAAVNGTVMYSFSEWKINPWRTLDIESEAHIPHYALHGDLVTMNDSMDLLPDRYIEIKGDLIVAITETAPPGLQVVEVDGLIYPGLLDAHNHPVYNVLGIIPFPQLFQERSQWQGHWMYGDFYDQYNPIMDWGGSDAQANNIWKLAEVRALAAGTTVIQGRNCNDHADDEFARLGMGINNAERFPSRIYSSTFPLEYTGWSSKKTEYWDRFVIHLSEGTNANALNEFATWQSLGMLDWRTSIIHGVPLGATQWTAMATADAHLIWSPKSNWVLYGATANVPQALETGVNVALAPDWTESGMPDILEEIRFADSINQSEWGGVLTPEFYARAVTRNAALALGMDRRLGQIAAGYQANLAVIPGDLADPYQALMQAHCHEVALTVVSGRPMYGDPAVMDQFAYLDNVENVYVCGVTKRLALAIVAHAIPESDRPFATVLSTLEDAYDAGPQEPCEFLGLDPCNGQTPTASPTPAGTATPTPLPSATPTLTPTPPPPTPTATPTMGVDLILSDDYFTPGEPFSLMAWIENPGEPLTEVPVFVVLEVYGRLFFYPSWTEYPPGIDYLALPQLATGRTPLTVIPEFAWPDTGPQSVFNLHFYGALLTPGLDALMGAMDTVEFGYGAA